MTMQASNATLSILALFLAACSQPEDTPPEAPRPVLSILVQETSGTSAQLTGTVEARVKSDLGFRILGRVTARKVEVGDIVKKGDVLASIDPLALQLAVKSAQSDLASAEAQRANAISTEQRQRALAASRTTTQSALEEAEQARRTADASVAKAKANLDKAEEQLGYTELRADFDGVITATSVEVGQVVSAGQTILTIARPEERDAVIDVPQAAMIGVKSGAPFDVALQLDPKIVAKGSVREIAPSADTATRTSRTRIALIDPPNMFRLGSVVTVRASLENEPQIWLPKTSILHRGTYDGVWIVDVKKKAVRFQKVRLDEEQATNGVALRIIEGVGPGDRVVTAGINKLTDGQSVRIDQETPL